MSNQEKITVVANAAKLSMAILLCSLLMGMTIPVVFSIIGSTFSSFSTFAECVTSVPFIIFSIIGSVISFGIIMTTLSEEEEAGEERVKSYRASQAR